MGSRNKTETSIALPVKNRSAKSGCKSSDSSSGIRRSRNSKWRALTLLGVHLVFAAHLAHWYATGSTLTPVEPSEAMQTLGSKSLINAGFIFFAITILTTLVFGRFFCGWGCHIVALQDMCTWLLKKLGIQPKPFRSRLLVFVPLLAAIFMFVVPTIVRLSMKGSKDPYSMHLTTEDFWERFPDWPIAAMTFLVCGFLIVYVLGNKGFCTYGCPYGGIFGLVDTAAPGKIRVTDDCEGCGHCTARCTSNVRVHEEVRRFGMVVDPGCMKCLDCVSVCPKDALYFGFGKPALLKKDEIEKKKTVRFDYTWKEESMMAAIFAVAIVVYWGMYDKIPSLLALGLAVISTYLIMTALRMRKHATLRFGQHHIRRSGRTTPFGVMIAIAAVGSVFVIAQAATAKAIAFVGTRRVQLAQPAGNTPAKIDAADQANIESGIDLLALGNRIGLLPMARYEWEMAKAFRTLGKLDDADACCRRAVQISPRFLAAKLEIARYAIRANDPIEGEQQLREIVDRDPEFGDAAKLLGAVLVRQNKPEAAVSILNELFARRPQSCNVGLALATAYHVAGDSRQCMNLARFLVERHPDNAEAHIFLATALVRIGEESEARRLLTRAIEINGDLGRPHFLLATLELREGLTREGIDHLDKALNREPLNATYTKFWAELVRQTEDINAAIAKWADKPANDRIARFKLMYLLAVAGRIEEATAIAANLNLPAPNQTQPQP